MKKISTVLFASCFLNTFGALAQPTANQQFAQMQLEKAATSYRYLLSSLTDSVRPPRTIKNGNLQCVATDDWTSGFFAASLWYLFEYSKDTTWRAAAEKWTNILENEKHNTHTHDLGFMLYCSYGNGLRLTGNSTYKQILIDGATSLCTRFNPKVGCIKSWDAWSGMPYPVIIDNMMNLEYLFWATRTTGDSTYYHIAVSHANTTLKNHFRDNYSSYHVVTYDSTNGNVEKKLTAQGAADESAWARGQSWALYGYTMMYRQTRDTTYLHQAQHIAAYIVGHLPDDTIPYWDYNVPQNSTEPRDASAAAIAASALLELSTYSLSEMKDNYFSTAEKLLKALATTQYTSETEENKGFILKHCVGHKPANSEIDVPLIYADYYYIEALIRYWKLAQTNTF